MDNTRKIFITITNGKKEQILEELKKSKFDISILDISEVKRGSRKVYRLKLIWFNITDSIKLHLRRVKEFIKYRKLEPLLGGGAFGLESFYGQIFDFITVTVPHGIAFNILIFAVKKSYKLFKTKKKEYIVFVSETRQPFDCKVKLLIPNNLESEELDHILSHAKELFINVDNIRNYFGNREIKIKYRGNYQWKIKFK